MSSFTRKSIAVVGLGFGDEGKGKKVHRLTDGCPESVVIRYSGGQQAGHTVYYNSTTGHVFSNFGAGTFNGVSTYWSKFCTFDPVGVIRELEILKSLNLAPVLYVDYRCPITTPFEKRYNQNNFDFLRNGTCGVGVGQTYEREEKFYNLQVGDLKHHGVHEIKIKNIHNWYKILEYQSARVASSDLDTYFEAVKEIIKSDNIHFVEGLNNLPSDLEDHQIIFEGSQGLLLDQNIGFFPHVTRSSVGSKNILNLCREYNIEPPKFELMTRAYQTRHGNGPMTNEEYSIELLNTKWETNRANQFQGNFRTSVLDLNLLGYAIQKDEHINKTKNRRINITCLDQLEIFKATYNGSIFEFPNAQEFVEFVGSKLGIEAQPETGP